MVNFVNTCYFLNHHYFGNLFAFLLENYVAVGLFYDETIWNNFLNTIFFKSSVTFEIRLHAYLQNTWQEDYLIKETKDPFLHGDFDSMDMFTRVTVENALLCFTAPNTRRDSVSPKMTCELLHEKGPKRVWKLLPSVLGSSIKNGRSSSLIIFLRNELDTWAIAFLSKPSSTPNRSDLIDWNRMLTSVNLKKTGMACRNIVIKNNTRCFKSALQ